ncbi:hypothetical protein GS399_11055 [Pedobacter sp. HMF7647]|uniref:Uncharacterized protein n=1 Tax=Hufsiella arboris TaxID=2695275 RepID=A0A7K1YBP8_9SPHI|nr:hypothetical protein [Hufsiella arboris]MXV51509.1 hypothetical protein [Hufsiella arboris]
MPRFTDEERWQRSIANIGRLRIENRRNRLINYRYRKSTYFRISMVLRAAFLLFLVLLIFSRPILKSGPEKIIKTNYTDVYEPRRYGQKIESYLIITIKDGRQFSSLSTYFSPDFEVGDRILTYRNFLLKIAYIAPAETPNNLVRTDSGGLSPCLFLLAFVLYSFFNLNDYNKSRELTAVLLVGSCIVLYYYFGRPY